MKYLDKYIFLIGGGIALTALLVFIYNPVQNTNNVLSAIMGEVYHKTNFYDAEVLFEKKIETILSDSVRNEIEREVFSKN